MAAALLAALWLLAGPAAAEEAYVPPEYGDPITLPGVEPDPVPEALAPAVAAYEAGEYSTARALFEPAADAGEPVALLYLGMMYRDGKGGLERNDKRELALFETAADEALMGQPQDRLTYRRAVYELAEVIRKRGGANSPPSLELCLIRISADLGFAPAQYRLFGILKREPGISIEGSSMLERSAAQGHPNALGFRGFIKSINPFSNHAEGFMLMHLAAKAGSQYARDKLSEAAHLNDLQVNGLILQGIAMSRSWRAKQEAPPATPLKSYRTCF